MASRLPLLLTWQDCFPIFTTLRCLGHLTGKASHDIGIAYAHLGHSGSAVRYDGQNGTPSTTVVAHQRVAHHPVPT